MGGMHYVYLVNSLGRIVTLGGGGGLGVSQESQIL